MYGVCAQVEAVVHGNYIVLLHLCCIIIHHSMLDTNNINLNLRHGIIFIFVTEILASICIAFI